MRRVAFGSALALVTLLSMAAAHATLIFHATLTGAAQVPSNTSTATGSATVTLESDNVTLVVDLAFSNLTGGPATAAHIHCCASPGANAGVALPFSGFPGATSGTYLNTFDLTTDLMIPLATFLTGLEAGQAYINIHDADFPGGEIRGQLTSVPEPSALGVLGLGAVAIVAAQRRRQAR